MNIPNISTVTWPTQYERLNKEDHKTRIGIEPISSDNRSTALPLNYLIVTSVIQVTTHQIFKKSIDVHTTTVVIDQILLYLMSYQKFAHTLLDEIYLDTTKPISYIQISQKIENIQDSRVNILGYSILEIKL